MDILIKNMEMPKKGQYLHILIAENGEMSYEHVYYDSPSAGFKLHKSKAVALPEQGDLISKASVLSLLRYYCYMREYEKDVRCEDCDNRNSCVVRPIMDDVNKLDTVFEATE